MNTVHLVSIPHAVAFLLLLALSGTLAWMSSYVVVDYALAKSWGVKSLVDKNKNPHIQRKTVLRVLIVVAITVLLYSLFYVAGTHPRSVFLFVAIPTISLWAAGRMDEDKDAMAIAVKAVAALALLIAYTAVSIHLD